MTHREAAPAEVVPQAAPGGPTGSGHWDRATCDSLIAELKSVRRAMLASQLRLLPRSDAVDPAWQASAVNLAHYLGMRRADLRRLQERLAWIGVSSLGRAETHVLANFDKVLGILHVLAGRPWTPGTPDEPTGYERGRALLERHADALLGGSPSERRVRIMVTMPSEAAHDASLVESLVDAGMDIARINCAHDGPAQWTAMAAAVRQAAQRGGRPVRILMDLGGPKLRTAEIEPAAAVLKLRPVRDDFGRVVEPARLRLRAAGAANAGSEAPSEAPSEAAARAEPVARAEPAPRAEPSVEVEAGWLAGLTAGDSIELEDTRGAKRSLQVVACDGRSALVTTRRTVYLAPGTVLRRTASAAPPSGRRAAARQAPVAGAAARRNGPAPGDAPPERGEVLSVPPREGRLTLQRGDRLHLLRDGIGRAGSPATNGRKATPARVACTLPKVLDALRPGDRVWFDDGHIGGVVRRQRGRAVEIEITVARDGGERLGADKGINLPDSPIDLPALTEQDLLDLETVARLADLVGLSFAESPDDVRALIGELRRLDAAHLGVVLKIETRRGFDHLPQMLFAAMGARSAGVMIARGDLAVECGYERMAEVQEEILWACEAAHVPVIWATQVLETLAKTGLPSRAEITDAAMGVRSECVMLNKGPHIVDAIRTLDDILRRMQQHQAKKRTLLRALKAWRGD
jgi:pyruvate kinase